MHVGTDRMILNLAASFRSSNRIPSFAHSGDRKRVPRYRRP
jgi:hypothetical protein